MPVVAGFTGRGYDGAGIIHLAREIAHSENAHVDGLYTACRLGVINAVRYVERLPVTCIACLGSRVVWYPVVTEEFEPGYPRI